MSRHIRENYTPSKGRGGQIFVEDTPVSRARQTSGPEKLYGILRPLLDTERINKAHRDLTTIARQAGLGLRLFDVNHTGYFGLSRDQLDRASSSSRISNMPTLRLSETLLQAIPGTKREPTTGTVKKRHVTRGPNYGNVHVVLEDGNLLDEQQVLLNKLGELSLEAHITPPGEASILLGKLLGSVDDETADLVNRVVSTSFPAKTTLAFGVIQPLFDNPHGSPLAVAKPGIGILQRRRS